MDDGRAAIAAVFETTYDIVLMDGSMPDVDGFEATRRIRAREAEQGCSRLPVVALTAHVVGAGADAWREAGMDGVLHKPFTVAKLADVLGQYLSASASGVPAALEGPAAPARSNPMPDGLAARTEDDPLLDESNLAQLDEMASLSGRDFIGRVLGLYVDHAPKAMGELRSTARSGDHEAVARAAHSLKSMSLNIGAARIAQRLAAVEGAARETGEVPSAEEVDAVAALLDQTVPALRARFGEALPLAA